MNERLKMGPLGSMARRLARTKFGQRALIQTDGPGILKRKLTARVYGGLALMLLSYLTGLPGLALLGYLSVKLSKPLIIGIGGPVVFGLVHIMFGLGVYPAGKNYAKDALLWATKVFVKKFA
jgi:hypothetical protein